MKKNNSLNRIFVEMGKAEGLEVVLSEKFWEEAGR